MIFSERIETLEWLSTRLREDLALLPDHVALLHGGLNDTDQQALVERFGRKTDALRVLLCSDVASEGLNLHYFCHRLIHFDLPWSLMVFQQRNGRIDRYGQHRQPLIGYLQTDTDVERIRGDLRILEVLRRKDDRANRDLGDPSAFLNLHDPDLEAAEIARRMADGQTAEQVEQDLEKEAAEAKEGDADWLLEFFSTDTPPISSPTDRIGDLPSLFADDYAFARAALQELGRDRPVAQWSADDASRSLTLTAPLDLQQRLRQVPREARSDDGRYVLSADSLRVADAIERARQARQDEQSWPDVHYLWPQHPISEWLRDRVLTHFGRHTAPVLRSQRLAEGERAFLILGLIPNRKGQPMLVDWQVVLLQGAEPRIGFEPLSEFCDRAGLRAGTLSNPAKPFDLSGLQSDLPLAVSRMQEHMEARQRSFESTLSARLESTLQQLRALQDRQIEQLELRLERSAAPEQLRLGRRERRVSQIRKVFDEYTAWVHDTLQTEPRPHLQVLAAVCR